MTCCNTVIIIYTQKLYLFYKSVYYYIIFGMFPRAVFQTNKRLSSVLYFTTIMGFNANPAVNVPLELKLPTPHYRATIAL